MESRPISLILVSFLFLAASACAENDDEYWRKKGEEARRVALESYHPDPLAEVYALNAAVEKYVPCFVFFKYVSCLHICCRQVLSL